MIAQLIFLVQFIIALFVLLRRGHQSIFKYKCQRFGARNETSGIAKHRTIVQEDFEFGIWQHTDATVAYRLKIATTHNL